MPSEFKHLSNLDRARKNGEIYCVINRQFDRSWRNFTLQSGHMYGYSPELQYGRFNGMFVVYQVRDNHVIVYQSDYKQNWTRHEISAVSKTASVIFEVASRRDGGVVFYKDTLKYKYDCSGMYEQHLTTEPFIPVPNMRIPMGKRDTITVSLSKAHESKCATAKEAIQRPTELKMKNLEQVVKIHNRIAEGTKDALGIIKEDW